MKKMILWSILLVTSSVHAQSVSPQFKMNLAGREKQIVVRDPQSGADAQVGSILDGVVIPPRATVYGNPALPGGLFGLNDGISRTNQIEKYNLTVPRDKAWIGRTIIVDDNSKAPASGADTASYGMSIYMQRPNWHRSSVTGEMDGLNITLRQANGDAAGILSNILTRNGFGTTLESYTGIADASGVPVKAVNAQLNVSNSRDNSNYGLVLQTVAGTNLNAGLRIASAKGTSWSNYIEMIASSGLPAAYIRGSDAAFVGGSIIPIKSFDANVGAPTNVYASTYTRNLVLDMQRFATLPTCNSASNGTIAYIGDARMPITTWNQIVSAGGGNTRAYVSCNGKNWRAFSS